MRGGGIESRDGCSRPYRDVRRHRVGNWWLGPGRATSAAAARRPRDGPDYPVPRGGLGPAVAGLLSLAGIAVTASLGGESAVEARCQVRVCAFRGGKGSLSCEASSG